MLIMGPEVELIYGLKFGTLVPSEVKEVSSINSFKKSIKDWYPSNCPCRLCKTDLANISFI